MPASESHLYNSIVESIDEPMRAKFKVDVEKEYETTKNGHYPVLVLNQRLLGVAVAGNYLHVAACLCLGADANSVSPESSGEKSPLICAVMPYEGKGKALSEKLSKKYLMTVKILLAAGASLTYECKPPNPPNPREQTCVTGTALECARLWDKKEGLTGAQKSVLKCIISVLNPAENDNKKRNDSNQAQTTGSESNNNNPHHQEIDSDLESDSGNNQNNGHLRKKQKMNRR